MIKVIKSGLEKEYFARCARCGTEMSYRIEDAKQSVYSSMTQRSIVCPVCHTQIWVNLLTEEEVRENMKRFFARADYSMS